MIAGSVQMLRNSGDKALIIREAVTHDDHALGGDFIFADVLAMVATAHLERNQCTGISGLSVGILTALYRRFIPTCHIPQISYTEDIEDGGSRVCGRQGIPCIPSNRLKISDIMEGFKKSLAASSFLEYYLIIIGE
jgi:hypothetical protein